MRQQAAGCSGDKPGQLANANLPELPPNCLSRCPGLANEEARLHLRASLPCLADLSLHE